MVSVRGVQQQIFNNQLEESFKRAKAQSKNIVARSFSTTIGAILASTATCMIISSPLGLGTVAVTAGLGFLSSLSMNYFKALNGDLLSCSKKELCKEAGKAAIAGSLLTCGSEVFKLLMGFWGSPALSITSFAIRTSKNSADFCLNSFTKESVENTLLPSIGIKITRGISKICKFPIPVDIIKNSVFYSFMPKVIVSGVIASSGNDDYLSKKMQEKIQAMSLEQIQQDYLEKAVQESKDRSNS